jgi:hypothetical protein
MRNAEWVLVEEGANAVDDEAMTANTMVSDFIIV